MTSEDYIVQLRDELKKLGGMRPLGEEYIRITGQSAPAGGVDYVGQLATRAMYADLWAWVQEHKPGSIISEDEWQALSASQNGNVPYYSTGDGSTTFRFPHLTGYPKFAGSVEEVGKFVKEGLPNITGTFGISAPNVYWLGVQSTTGAFTTGHAVSNITAAGVSVYQSGDSSAVFDASRANSLYGNSDHVTPETVCIIAGVIAFGVPSAVGQADKDGILAELELHGTELNRLDKKADATIAPGFVMPFAANADPEGWLFCNGATVSRTTYANLFKAIGTLYGAGDGSTTFHLPNSIDRFIEGSGTAGSYKAPGLPNFTGTIRSFSGATGGAFSQGGTYTMEDPGSSGSSYANVTVTLNPATVNGIYGASNTVQPPAVTMRYFIKY